jgi:ABC-2 type transport system permease protein
MSQFFRLFAVFARIGALNDLAYRANFFVQVLESLVTAATAVGTVGVVLGRTERLGDWEPWQLLALIGVYFIVLGLINTVLAPSLTKFIEDVQQGTLDFTLTKPADAQLLVSVSEFRVWKLIDAVVGAGILAFALAQGGVTVGFERAGLFCAALLAGGAIVYGLWMILATLAFWFLRIENLLMIFWSLYGAGRWPVGLYPGWLRWLLTLVVPIAFAVSVPAEAIAGRLEPGTLEGAIVLALAMLAFSRWFFRVGLRHYAGASA